MRSGDHIFRWTAADRPLRGWSGRRSDPLDSAAGMQRDPMPVFWIAVQVGIIICVLISAVIVIIKL